MLGDDVSTGDPDAVIDSFMAKVGRSRLVVISFFLTCIILDVLSAAVQLAVGNHMYTFVLLMFFERRE